MDYILMHEDAEAAYIKDGAVLAEVLDDRGLPVGELSKRVRTASRGYFQTATRRPAGNIKHFIERKHLHIYPFIQIIALNLKRK